MRHSVFFVFGLLFSMQVFAEQQSVVLFSLDGFRWDYMEKHNAVNMKAIASKGVRVTKMWPVYPSKTFPNHLSIVTGLLPVNHGIVDNKFCDTQRGECYSMGDGRNDSSWLQGIPLWNLASMQGLRSAAYFWPESDARINGMTPDYYYHYSKHSDYQSRIDQIIQWLSLPEAQRPHFVAGYFSLVDTKGHDHGPDSQEVRNAVQRVDALIADLYNRLMALPQPVNLVVVADHGMSPVDPSQAIDLRELDIPDEWTIKDSGARVMLYRKNSHSLPVNALKQSLRAKAEGRYLVLEEQDLIERLYVGSPRVPDIVLETQSPRVFDMDGKVTTLGTHGYTNTEDMAATFFAVGPAFKRGLVIEEMENLEVYPTIADVLGLKLLRPVDSNGKVLKQGLK